MASGGAVLGGSAKKSKTKRAYPTGGVTVLGGNTQIRPDDFTFEAVTGMLPGVDVIAQMVITGLPEGVYTTLKLAGNGSPQWRRSRNGGSFISWVTGDSDNCINGDVIQIQNTSAAEASGVVSATLTLNGNVSATFWVTTHSDPAVNFDIESLNLPTVRGAPWFSEAGEVGITERATLTSDYPGVSVPINVGGDSTRISINGGEFGLAPGVLQVGDSFRLSNRVGKWNIGRSVYNAGGVEYVLLMLPKAAEILSTQLYDGNRLIVSADYPISRGDGGTDGFTLKSNYGPIELTFDESQSGSNYIALVPDRLVYSHEILTLDYSNPGNTGFGASIVYYFDEETYLLPLLSFESFGVQNLSHDVILSQTGGAILLGASAVYKHKHYQPKGGYSLAGKASTATQKHIFSVLRLSAGGAAFSRKNKNYTDETLALSFITLPVWLNRGSVRAMARWLNTWWQQVHQWVQSPLNQIDPETCGLAVLGLLAWQRNIDRFDNEPEKLYRARVKYAFVNAIDAGSVAGTKRIFERLGIGQIDIKERVNGKDWDVIVLTMDDSQYSENVTLLQWLVQAYGRTCRRYEFSVNSPTRAGIAVHEFGTEFNYEDAA